MNAKKNATQRMGQDGFAWFIGVVECVIDPKKLGRVKVRVLGDHTQDKADIETAQLPWAIPMLPVTSAAMNGIGETAVGMVTGTWVVGFYRDSWDKQQPIIMGSLPGIPEDPANPAVGFNDPFTWWPDATELDLPDSNRLARGIVGPYADGETHPSLITRKIEVQKGMPTATNIWDEPDIEYHAEYPYNQVHEWIHHPLGMLTEWGNISENDSTPNASRLFRWHGASHNSLEIFHDGREIHKIYGDNFELDLAGKKLRVDGDYEVTIKGNKTEKICGDYWQHIEGKKITIVEDDIITVGHKKVIEHSDEDNITRSLKQIQEISLDTNLRHSNIELKDTACVKATTLSPETVIAAAAPAAVAIPPVPPTGGYGYTPYAVIALSQITINAAPGGHGGPLYAAVPLLVAPVDASSINQIRVDMSAIFHDAPIINHTGDTFIPGPIGIDPVVEHEYIIPTPGAVPPPAIVAEIVEHPEFIYTPKPVITIPAPTVKPWPDVAEEC